jgi:hypothetical protein
VRGHRGGLRPQLTPMTGFPAAAHLPGPPSVRESFADIRPRASGDEAGWLRKKRRHKRVSSTRSASASSSPARWRRVTQYTVSDGSENEGSLGWCRCRAPPRLGMGSLADAARSRCSSLSVSEWFYRLQSRTAARPRDRKNRLRWHASTAVHQPSRDLSCLPAANRPGRGRTSDSRPETLTPPQVRTSRMRERCVSGRCGTSRHTAKPQPVSMRCRATFSPLPCPRDTVVLRRLRVIHALLHEPEVFLPLTGRLRAALSHRPGLADLEHRTP